MTGGALITLSVRTSGPRAKADGPARRGEDGNHAVLPLPGPWSFEALTCVHIWLTMYPLRATHMAVQVHRLNKYQGERFYSGQLIFARSAKRFFY